MPGGSGEGEEGKRVCQVFLKNAILGFTNRVGRCHSWYKHLTMGIGDCRFEFCLDLTTNMYFIDGKWIKAVDGA